MDSEDKKLYLSPIATPMASDKLSSKLLSLTTKCKKLIFISSGKSQINQKRSKRSQ